MFGIAWKEWLLSAVLSGAVLSFGCSGERPVDELGNLADDFHSIANPTRNHGLATGSACASTRREALTSARRVAQYNLRSLTGQARYQVRFDILAERQERNRYCIDVSARAIP